MKQRLAEPHIQDVCDGDITGSALQPHTGGHTGLGYLPAGTTLLLPAFKPPSWTPILTYHWRSPIPDRSWLFAQYFYKLEKEIWRHLLSANGKSIDSGS